MNKQTLAREILKLFGEWESDTIRYPDHQRKINILTMELAQLVLEEEDELKELREISVTSCACKFKEDTREQLQECLRHEQQKEQAKQEQKEKDAEIVRKKGKMYMAEDAFNAIADQIMSS